VLSREDTPGMRVIDLFEAGEALRMKVHRLPPQAAL
jgi:hypothetical protein